MSIENRNLNQDEDMRLNKDEAHEEANILSAHLEVSPKTGKIKEGYKKERETTAEDYNEALKALEELKKIAQDEPTFERIIHKIQDIPLKVGVSTDLALNAVIWGVGRSGFHPLAAAIMGDKTWQEYKSEDMDIKTSDIFNDAENILKALKNEAENFGKVQLKKIDRERKREAEEDQDDE